MKVLHLTLKKKWFDMTDSGDKPDEYREITDYWVARLCKETPTSVCDLIHNDKGYDFKKFDHVFARNGYNPKNRSWLRKWSKTSVGFGEEKWGAEVGKRYFIIKLGERILTHSDRGNQYVTPMSEGADVTSL